MKKTICLISLILCVCLFFAGCGFEKDAEYVEFFDSRIRSFYILEYDEISILGEKRVSDEDIMHYSESQINSARKIEDVIAEMPKKGYKFSYDEYEKDSQLTLDSYFCFSSDGSGFSWYTLGLNVTKCEELYIKVKEKRDTFLISYYRVNTSHGLYSKRKELEKELIKTVEEVGKQDILIRYKS